jgi:hypothetical protein
LDVQQLARSFTEQAVLTLVEALRDPRLKVQAAVAILDRGWGRPVTPVVANDASDRWELHLLAAKAISVELRAEREPGPPLIEGAGSAEPQHNGRDFLAEPALE